MGSYRSSDLILMTLCLVWLLPYKYISLPAPMEYGILVVQPGNYVNGSRNIIRRNSLKEQSASSDHPPWNTWWILIISSISKKLPKLCTKHLTISTILPERNILIWLKSSWLISISVNCVLRRSFFIICCFLVLVYFVKLFLLYYLFYFI